MAHFKRPRTLERGDKIAIVSPSWGGPNVFPDIYEAGLSAIRTELGLEPVEFPTARMSPDDLASKPETRANDINAAFEDDSIAGIVASIGGDDSVRLLPYLDTDLILAHPKIIMGSSDLITVLTYLNTVGLVTFHGPVVMAGLAQIPALGERYKSHLSDVLFGNATSYEYQPFPEYAHGYPNWVIPENLGKVNQRIANLGWVWMQKAGIQHGYFWGGCIEVLEFLKGTDYWPPRSFFDDTFLLLETSEEAPSPQRVKRMLRNYGSQTILNRINGLVFGRPRDYSNEQRSELQEVVRQVVVDEFGRDDIPIVLDFDVGHTDPQFIVPFGIRATISSDDERVFLAEPVFREA